MTGNSGRTTARFGGLFMIIVFSYAFFWMQKTLVQVKRTSGGSRSGVITASAEAARNILGPEGYVAAEGDLQGDGANELVVARRAATTADGLTLISRAVVLAPAGAEAGYNIIFDTNRSFDVPIAAIRAAAWRPWRLHPRRLELEAYDRDSRPLGLRLEVTWDAENGHYHRVVAENPTPAVPEVPAERAALAAPTGR